MAKKSKMPKPTPWPVAAIRTRDALREEVASLSKERSELLARVAELEGAARKAHDYLADLAGRLGTNPHTIDMDERAFKPLCKALFGIG